MKQVVVLMSTYNGEKYLKEQIDSVLSQIGVEIKLVIRDDGSKDNTKRILKEYTLNNPNILLLLGENCGAEKSFYKLCEYAKEQTLADYYAFCDQDDVWLKDKLLVAVSQLNNKDQKSPNLYFSNLKMVDSDLNYMRNLFAEREVDITKRMALIQIFTYGCTCVFNRKALLDYCFTQEDKFYHDGWMFTICAYLGNIIYDKEGHILYRQHSCNLSGEKVTGFSLFLQRLNTLRNGNFGPGFEMSAKALLDHFSERLDKDDIIFISKIAFYRKSLIKKLNLLFSREYRTGRFSKDLLIKTRILINKL